MEEAVRGGGEGVRGGGGAHEWIPLQLIDELLIAEAQILKSRHIVTLCSACVLGH